MKNLLKYILFCTLSASVVACSDGTNETVESAYMLPILPNPAYKFSRNGESSVNTLECGFLKTPIDRLFSEYMSVAAMGNKDNYEAAKRLYHEGIFGLKPREEIAASPTHTPNRDKMVNDFDSWFASSAEISGFGASNPLSHKEREAVKGRSGYVGNSANDFDVCFVDENGIAVAEVYKYAISGAVYLDKIVNKHLNPELLKNAEIIAKHNQTQLLKGHNYTQLEHHWDLAYGYYQFWKPLAQSEGLPALKGCEERILNAFVNARRYLADARHAEMQLQADTIRQELSKVVAVRTMHLLIGDNTTANLKESPQNAFRMLSQAYGMIYASQFAADANGKPIISTPEITSIINEMVRDGGLWNKERLMADETTAGSLRNIAGRIGKTFGISTEEIKK